MTDPHSKQLADLDYWLQTGQLTQSEYDLRKARVLAAATQSPGSHLWHTIGIVLIVLVCVVVGGYALTALGS
jgi:hypothetical protein